MTSQFSAEHDSDSAGSGVRPAVLYTVLTVFAVALVAAIVMTSLWLVERGAAGETRTERAVAAELDQQYVDKASEVMTWLMTIRQDTLEEDVDRITANIEGDFESQFAPRQDSYREVIELSEVVADGSIIAAAVEERHPDRADVVMAVDQTIGNEQTDEPQDRTYRLRITVNQHDDGTMKVAGVNFIP